MTEVFDLPFTGYGASEGNMDGFTDTVEEQASDSGMAGYASVQNRTGALSFGFGSPTSSLVMLWIVAVLAYSALGYFFKGRRSG